MKPLGCVYCWADTHKSDRPIPQFHAEYIYEGNGVCTKHLNIMWNTKQAQDDRAEPSHRDRLIKEMVDEWEWMVGGIVDNDPRYIKAVIMDYLGLPVDDKYRNPRR